MEKNERGALYYTLGWMSAMYLSSNAQGEKRFIVSVFKSVKEDYGITDSNSLNEVIEDYQNGKE